VQTSWLEWPTSSPSIRNAPVTPSGLHGLCRGFWQRAGRAALSHGRASYSNCRIACWPSPVLFCFLPCGLTGITVRCDSWRFRSARAGRWSYFARWALFRLVGATPSRSVLVCLCDSQSRSPDCRYRALWYRASSDYTGIIAAAIALALGAEAYDSYRRRVPMLVPFGSA